MMYHAMGVALTGFCMSLIIILLQLLPVSDVAKL